MKRKRYALLTLAMLIIASLVVACQNPDVKEDSTTEPKGEEAKKEMPKEEAPKEEKEPEETTSKETSNSKELNIYSSRHYDVDKTVYEMFEKETGIKVNVVEGKGPELLERLIREKDDTQADLFLTVGAETLYPLKENALLESFSSDTISQNVPENLRGDGWSSIMYRARIIAYEKGKTDPKTITSYADLKKDEYKGKILVRSSSSSYNVALLSSLIQLNGLDEGKDWAAKVVQNMARKPKGNDRDQAKAIVAGEGDLAIMNSYYFVRMANSSDPLEVEVSEKIGLIFPESTHVNLSYAGLISGNKNKENAIKFIEFLTTEPVQKLYAEKNGEFPVNPNVERTDVQKSWGEFTIQNINFEELGKYGVDATMAFDEAKWE